LTCPSYGRIGDDGTPANPASYDYQRAARDALHFAALFDRFTQNLRRVLGYDVQYFATIEPQRRLAPHVHVAMRGTISRAELRQLIAATYHQVWWPSTDAVRFEGDYLPVWYEARSGYLDPATGELLPTWDQALDAIGRTMSRCMWSGSGPSSTPRRARRVQGLRPVHRVFDQVPDQTARRLPPPRHQRPAGARRTARRGAAV
jgi:Replication initiator protein, pSAM2